MNSRTFKSLIRWVLVGASFGPTLSVAMEGGGSFKVRKSDPIAHSVATMLRIVPPVNGKYALINCTATFISKDILITAAHCLAPSPKQSPQLPDKGADLSNPNSLLVHLGNISSLSPADQTARPIDDGSWVKVVDFRINENFKPQTGTTFVAPDTCERATSPDNDIALLKIDEKDVPKHFKIKPVMLLETSDSLEPGTNLTLYGTGETVSEAMKNPDIRNLHGLNIEILFGMNPVTSCITIAWPADHHDKNGNNFGLDHGDSGGPAFIKLNGRLKLAGIDSGGESYESVPYFIKWIQEKTNEMDGSFSR